MSKYGPLSERLAGHPGDQWRASFAEIEEVLGFPLPRAARTRTAWWSNNSDRRHSRAWTLPGWEVGEVDHTAGAVTFRRPVSEAELQNPTVQETSVQVVPAVEPRRFAPDLGPLKRPSWGLAAAIAAGVALTAGVGALVLRGVRRRRAPPGLTPSRRSCR